MILRSLILFCLLNFLFMTYAERLHHEGELLAKFRNLPHRALGMLYWATQLEPDRDDFMRDYLYHYMQMERNELFLEGQTRPVVPMLSMTMARRFPLNPDIQKLRLVFLYNHFKKLDDIPIIPELQVDEGWIREEGKKE